MIVKTTFDKIRLVLEDNLGTPGEGRIEFDPRSIVGPQIWTNIYSLLAVQLDDDAHGE